MARKDRLSEEIRLLTEMLKLLWLTLIALIGSVSGLALAELASVSSPSARASLPLSRLLASLDTCIVDSLLGSLIWRRFNMKTFIGVSIFVILGAALIGAAWTISH